MIEAFLATFRQTANVMLSCRAAGIDRSTAYDWFHRDPEFLARFREAELDANDVLEAEMHRRGVLGYDRPISIGGQREVVREYSDPLLLALARARMPHKYRERYEGPPPPPAPIYIGIGVDASATATAIAGPSSGGGLVDAYTFATHPDFCALSLEDKPMERMILQEFMRPGAGYNELVDICGMRSGKGTVGSVISWYKIYRLLELSDPQRFYGLTPGQTIGTVNMALSEDQARLNVFKHIKDRIDHGGKWFQEVKAFCEANISNWRLELELRLPKNLSMRCGHSRARSLVGGTNIAVIFDEICKYRSAEGMDNAEAVYTQMKATTATFGEEALIVSLSSPEWEGDYGMQLLRMATERDDGDIEERCPTCRPRAEDPNYVSAPTKSHPRMFGLSMASWEANTGLSYERLWDSQNGAANPRAFWRDFGARPAEAQEAYYPDPTRWDKQSDPALRYPYDSLGRLADWWVPCCPSRRFVHVDLGLSRDACGIAMAHRPVPGCSWFPAPTGAEPNPRGRKAVIDICVQVKPEPKARGQRIVEIDFEDIRSLVRSWQERGFAIKDGKVTYDGWQSIDSRQQLRKEGFRTAEFSLDRDLRGHDTLQELINTDQVAYPAHPVLIREAKQLQLRSGRKADHPPGGSKDLVDAAAGAVYHAVSRGGRRSFIGGRATGG